LDLRDLYPLPTGTEGPLSTSDAIMIVQPLAYSEDISQKLSRQYSKTNRNLTESVAKDEINEENKKVLANNMKKHEI
jgi:hypothetical protein